MRFQFIDEHQEQFPVRRMCDELNVSPSGHYAWRTRSVSAREMANRALYKKIETVYNENHPVYGSPRIYRELKDQGVVCSVRTVSPLRPIHIARVEGFQALAKTEDGFLDSVF